MDVPRPQGQQLQPQEVGVILSYQCQDSCKHCLYNCGPDWKEWMAVADLLPALQAVQNWSPAPHVYLTGGEPFLNFSLLKEAVELGCQTGLLKYVETSADWCDDPELVEERFSILQQSGLQAILISCSPFHAETIPLQRTMLAIDKALDVFGPFNVMVFLPEWIDQIRRFGTHTPTPISRYIEAYGMQPAGLLLWDGYELISGGRAGYQLGFLAEKTPATSFRRENCRHEILYSPHYMLDLYGNIIPVSCSGFSLGSWRDLPQFLQSYAEQSYPELIQILIDAGPYGLSQFSQKEFGYDYSAEGYAGKCHLCVDVRRYLFSQAEFGELRPAQFYRNLGNAAGS